MIMSRFIAAIFLMVLPAAYGCMPASQQDTSPVIARVGNHQLTMHKALELAPDIAFLEDTLAAINNFKQQWVRSKVTEDEARRLSLQNDEAFQERMARMEQQLLEEMLQEYVLAENSADLNVTRDEAQNYFQANRDKFVLNERYVRYRHITTETRTEVDNARSDLMRGVEWETILEQYSIDPELQLRQSTQFLPISMALSEIPMLNRYLNVIGISEISPVHFANGQYHFVQLREIRNEGDHPDFEWLIPQIQQWLKLEKSKRITNAYKRNLYLQAESNNEIEQLNNTELQSALNDYLSN